MRPAQSESVGLDERDPLRVLEVFDRLVVGPVRVEPKRLLCPYRIARKGRQAETTLICRYEENVFDPSDLSSVNLASVISAQVALNYGLFCKTLEFRGSFDSKDRRFLRWAVTNTAREIYVKKFLEPNIFLINKVRNLPAVRKKSYLRADLVFNPGDEKKGLTRAKALTPDQRRIAIMSSGGKDSLLTFGLTRELGFEVHPLFVNESGRHWFTGRNAYGFFKENIPRTSRVWINSDRVFSWMLRQMPFIRKDFFRIRSDEYPVRLWTVSVFLFSILPVIHKKGIGRVLIGNEYDTSHRTETRGIVHYDGLYDQSRYFDHALTKYFLSKGWSLSLFSILRPLSEMAIQKVLAERYPDIQEHQMSCHAAHKADDRFLPCGSCEKCRRIVGMLLAIDADPARCGYTAPQIKDCLRQVARKGVHQEPAGKKHLMHMLVSQGRIDPIHSGKSTREHPEILKLRFDPERSAMSEIPLEFRAPLYALLLKHLSGAVKRVGREWIDIDPFSDPDIARP